MTPEPRRGPGRPPRSGGGASKAAEAPPEQTAAQQAPTAQERLAELEALRQLHGGLPIPMPDGMHGAAIALPNEALGGAGLHVPNRAMKEAEAYFAALAEIGTPSDMDLAWTMWKTAHGIANPKGPFEARFNALKDAAGRRHEPLSKAALQEAADHRHRIEHRNEAADLRRQIAAAEGATAKLRDLLVRHETLRPA